MKCPNCACMEDRVVDSRYKAENDSIRRRRECEACGYRFTTYERPESALLQVVKSDGQRQPYDRNRILEGVRKACEKRGVATATLEQLVDNVTRKVLSRGAGEIPSYELGDLVMHQIRRLDPIAYIRFASVYLNFNDVQEFVDEIERLAKERPREVTGEFVRPKLLGEG